MEKQLDFPEIVKETIQHSEELQNKANQLITGKEDKIQSQMAKFMKSPEEKVLFTQMMDQGLRPTKKLKVAQRITSILKGKLPNFLSPIEKIMVILFKIFGRLFYFITVPIMVKKIRKDTGHMILSDEKKVLHKHLHNRKKENVFLNINHLGEAVLGKDEALNRFNEYLADLRDPEIGYISVKITGVLAQMQAIAYDHNLKILEENIVSIFKVAKENNKFVNIDMEEYRFLDATMVAFMNALDHPELKDFKAGLAMQAYLPDSFPWQKKLTEWAKKRVANGGSPIFVRLVKGANLEIEEFDSKIYGWENPIYRNKVEVDASFKVMLEYGVQEENIKAVHLGIASHNIFELSYSYTLASKLDIFEYMTFEMLEGMSDHVRRALVDLHNETNSDKELKVLLYAPVVGDKNFINAIAYLVRRFDEITGDENFLRYSFNLTVGSKQWEYLRKQFVDSIDMKEKISHEPFRKHFRDDEKCTEKGSFVDGYYSSDSDTEWSLARNRDWANNIISTWKKEAKSERIKVPVVVAGEEIFENRKTKESIDKSRTDKNIVVNDFALANEEDIAKAIDVAKADPDGWRNLTVEQRHEAISKVAVEFRKARADLIGAMAANTGKVFAEADVEVTEAIDFAEYYPYSNRIINDFNGVKAEGKGVGVVVSPWNFPVAIPAGGLLSSLASGNTVILKPSSDAVLAAWEMVQCFWRAGISKNTLQFLPCPGSLAGEKLINNKDVEFVIFTGGTDTALRILEERPGLYLAAETGGKNATIVTTTADYDQAINNIIHSAFSNCGQKCSATSLLILEKVVFNDEKFKRQLVDAVKSYNVGSAWKLENRMGPLVNKPSGEIEKAMNELEPGESWLIKPENIENNPYMWKPCIKWNVKAGSFCHMTELFGPVLSVMCADNLEHAIELVNATGFGLTSGLESLDEAEQEYWKENIKAGNLYINRVTTGAVVLRQPFGGMNKSAIGPGSKAGGPNYTLQFMNYEEVGDPTICEINGNYRIHDVAKKWQKKLADGQVEKFASDIEKGIKAVNSYLYNFENHFGNEVDYFKIPGQDNLCRYIPAGKIAIRVHESDSLFSIISRVAGSTISGCETILSIPKELNNDVVQFILSNDGKEWLGDTRVIRQNDQELIKMIPNINRIRYSSVDCVPDIVMLEAAKTGFYVAKTTPLQEGRLELLQYLQEQSISHNYHRYGNLGMRGLMDN